MNKLKKAIDWLIRQISFVLNIFAIWVLLMVAVLLFAADKHCRELAYPYVLSPLGPFTLVLECERVVVVPSEPFKRSA